MRSRRDIPMISYPTFRECKGTSFFVLLQIILKKTQHKKEKTSSVIEEETVSTYEFFEFTTNNLQVSYSKTTRKSPFFSPARLKNGLL